MFLRSYSLPTWDLVAGEDKEKLITLQHRDGNLYELEGATAVMTVVDFVNREMAPVLTLPQTIQDDENGVRCILDLVIGSDDSAPLHGKYLYCVTITDGSGNTAKLRGPMMVRDAGKQAT